MVSFTVEDGRFGSLETVRVRSGSGAHAQIALRGATLLSWDPGLDRIGELIDGYRDEAELLSPTGGARCALMAPFSNRVADGRYVFDGETHDLLPGVPARERQILHGFLRLIDTEVLEASATGDTATVRLGTSALRPGAFAGYPFAVDVEVVFTFSGTGLTVRMIARNVGDRAAPYGCGWHPYFRPGLDGSTDGIGSLELRVPARTRIRTDASNIPLPGGDAYAAIDDGAGFRVPRPIGDAVLDEAYTDLERNGDGIARTVVHNPRTGTTLTVWQSGGLMHVFTGDTLDRDRRQSIALEPVELMTDAFNRPDCADKLRLEPGATRDFAFGLEVATEGPVHGRPA